MVDKLLDEVQDKNIPISNLLRKAKVLASRLDKKDLLAWIDKELSGYGKKEKVPDYRMVHGQVKAWNPYHGWIPVIMRGDWASVTSRGVSQSVNELEALTGSDSPTFEMPFPDSVTAQMITDSPFPTKSSLFIGSTAIVGILNSVRNKLFDWLLELDKGGIKVDEAPVAEQAAARSALGFDERKSVLSINGQEVEISKSKNSDPHYLLTILFRDTGKEWACDEIWEDQYFVRNNRDYDAKTDWNKLYNAARAANEKVAIATTIQDFLDISKASISINKKYLG